MLEPDIVFKVNDVGVFQPLPPESEFLSPVFFVTPFSLCISAASKSPRRIVLAVVERFSVSLAPVKGSWSK